MTLELDSPAAPSEQETSRFAMTDFEDGRYLMMRYRPALPGGGRRQRRDWVFLVETSADRDPLLARTQIEIVRGLLEHAEQGDTFSVLTAGVTVKAFADGPLPTTPENVAAAVAFLEQAHLIGALDLDHALAAAAPLLAIADNPYLVHIGSGIPVLGERRAEELVKRLPARPGTSASPSASAGRAP